MIKAWYSVALGSVLSISFAGASPQYLPHLGLDVQDQDALAHHRLTADNLRQTFAVDRELLQLLERSPEVDARAAALERRLDRERLGTIAVAVQVYEAMPEIVQILQRQKISARDYVLTKILAMIVEMADVPPEARAVLLAGPAQDSFMTPALKFWTAMDPALKAEAAEWRRVRREMAKHGRERVW